MVKLRCSYKTWGYSSQATYALPKRVYERLKIETNFLKLNTEFWFELANNREDVMRLASNTHSHIWTHTRKKYTNH